MSAIALPSQSAAATSTWRDLLLAVLAGALCYGVSCLLVAPEPVIATPFGVQWQSMSEAPFELRGQFPHRILGPLLAHFLGMGGAQFVLFARGLAVLLLGTVFFFCRCRGAAIVDALLVTLAIALTAAVQMYKQHWVGYVDPLCYSLFFCAWLAAKRPAVVWTLFLANLFNHELAAFLLPWLWFVRRRAGGSKRADMIGAGAALAIYGAFYLWVRAHAKEQMYSVDYFADHPLFPGGSFVTLWLALTHLVVAFGPVLAVIAWHQAVRSHGRERWHLWLVLAGVVGIFCIAWDWQRHSNLIVLPFALASVRFLQDGNRAVYAGLIVLGAVLMLLIPPWSATAWPTRVLTETQMLFDAGVAILLPPGPDGAPVNIGFGPLSAALTGWLPRIWPTLAVLAAIFAAICSAGWGYARWSERRVLPRD